MTILEAMEDPNLFGSHFEPRDSWGAWRAFLAVLFGLPLDNESRALYRRHTGRETIPESESREAWLVVGARGGKSRISALVAVYLACIRFMNAERILAPGERGRVMVIAADRYQARVVFEYVQAMVTGVPMFAAMLQGEPTASEIHLANRISIEIHTASFRTVRGYTIVAAILDEIAVWRSDSVRNPDVDIVRGVRRGMLTVPGSLLLGISSPYARRGVLWEMYRKHHGTDGDPVLVWQADTRAMNPQAPADEIRRAYEEDEPAAAAEYGAEFRRDIEAYLAREAIEAVVVPGRRELAPVSDQRYFAFVDPSGGSRIR